MPRRFLRVCSLLLALGFAVTGCASVFSMGREFPSPARDAIRNGTTTKADLVKLFGEPTQVGIDDGDPSWTWLYFRKGDPDLTKQLTVRFGPNDVVKSFSFSSNFPEDMKTLR
jgi:hypothetical protein